MRKTVKLFIILLVITIIYFGYSSWLDGVAIYNINGYQMGSADWTRTIEHLNGGNSLDNPSLYTDISYIKQLIFNYNADDKSEYILRGIMAPNSLAKTLLDPFKVVLVGGVFVSFVPLVKQLFFGTFIGSVNYLKKRQIHILYNYEKTILYVDEIINAIKNNSIVDLKKRCSSFATLEFKPKFLEIMIFDIESELIKSDDFIFFLNPALCIKESIEQMYKKELAKVRGNYEKEMLFDFKRGYEYASSNSRYSRRYYRAFDSLKTTKNNWRMFSFEFSKINLCLIYSLLIAITFFIILEITRHYSNFQILHQPKNFEIAITGLFLGITYMLLITFHAITVFGNKKKRKYRSKMLVPAIVIYSLILLAFITILIGFYGIWKVGDITSPNSATKILTWFNSLSYLIVSTCLVFYVIATIIDNNKIIGSLSKKIILQEVLIPLIIWVISTLVVILSILIPETNDFKKWLQLISQCLLYGYWIYIFISSFLVDNITIKKLNINHKKRNKQINK